MLSYNGGRRLSAGLIASLALDTVKRRADVMSHIYDDVKAGREPDMDKFDRVMREYACSGCDRVILACTGLSVLQKYREMPVITLDLPKRDRFVLVGFIWGNSEAPARLMRAGAFFRLSVVGADGLEEEAEDDEGNADNKYGNVQALDGVALVRARARA